jgi:hypothetical protein
MDMAHKQDTQHTLLISKVIDFLAAILSHVQHLQDIGLLGMIVPNLVRSVASKDFLPL